MKKNNQENDMTIYEASDYWDEHDFSECDDVREVRDLRKVL